jgi:hypothetical protein
MGLNAKRAASAAVLMLAGSLWGVPAVERPPFFTGFESGGTPPYHPGDLDGQGDGATWAVRCDPVVVQASGALERAQSAAFAPGSSASLVVEGRDQPVLWFDGLFETPGSTAAPSPPPDKRSSVLFFSATNGLLALDGDGAGSGTFVQVLGSLPPGAFRLSVRQDYSNKVYDVWVDGLPAAAGLGFKDNDLAQLNVVRRDTDAGGLMDFVSVTPFGPDEDTDGDTLDDLAEFKAYGTSRTSADTDGDRFRDGDELFAATDPLDPTSYLGLEISRPPADYEVRFDGVTGKTYALQGTDDPGVPGSWADVPGYESIPGTGGVVSILLAAPPGPTRFHRVRLVP